MKPVSGDKMKSFSAFLFELRMYDPDIPTTMDRYPFEDNKETQDHIKYTLDEYVLPELEAHGFKVDKKPNGDYSYEYNIGDDTIGLSVTKIKTGNKSYAKRIKLRMNKKGVYLLLHPNYEKYEFVRRFIETNIPRELQESFLLEDGTKDAATVSSAVMGAIKQWENDFKEDKFGTESDEKLKEIFVSFVFKNVEFLGSSTLVELAQKNFKDKFVDWKEFPQKTLENVELVDALTKTIIACYDLGQYM